MSENILEKQLFEIIQNEEMAEHIKLAKIDMLIKLGVDVNVESMICLMPLGITDNVKILEKLIEVGANVNQVNKKDMTPLEMALRYGNYQGAEFLIGCGADVNRRGEHERTPLMKVNTVDGAKILLEYGADINACDEYNHGVVHEAFCGEHLDVAEYFIEKGADTSKMQELFSYCYTQEQARFLVEKGLKPEAKNLSFVVRHDFAEVALVFIEHGENLGFEKTNEKGNNILAEALRELEDERVAIALIDKGCKLISQDNEDSILLEAAYNGRLEVVKKMLEKGEDINQRNRYGQTPLYLAVLNGKEEVVEYLLEEGADYNIARDNGDTPLMCAVKHQNCDVLEKLLDHMKEVPDKFSMACNLCLDGSDERELLISFMERITEDKPSQRNKVMLDIIKDRY